jgi:hypothetical protein
MLPRGNKNVCRCALIVAATFFSACAQPAATPERLPPAPDAIVNKGDRVTEAQLMDIVTRVSPAAVAELQVRGASTVFVDVAGMSGWDDRLLAWIAAVLPVKIGSELEKAGFRLSKNRAAQKTLPAGTNTNVPVTKRFDLQPVPDFVVVLTVSLTSAPGTVTLCVQPPSDFLSLKRCEQRQSFEVR